MQLLAGYAGHCMPQQQLRWTLARPSCRACKTEHGCPGLDGTGVPEVLRCIQLFI